MRSSLTSRNAEEPWDLVIGRVTAPFGVDGEVRVRPETDFPDRFLTLKQVCLELPDGSERLLIIARARLTAKGVLLQFKGCSGRAEAEPLRGALLKIKQSMAVALPPDSYWLHELIGLQVVTEEGEDLGEVIEVIRAPGNDVYVTPKAMIPALRQVVRGVDVKARRMLVSLPPESRAEP
jgi:16S rRNA processing protein RimM